MKFETKFKKGTRINIFATKNIVLHVHVYTLYNIITVCNIGIDMRFLNNVIIGYYYY